LTPDTQERVARPEPRPEKPKPCFIIARPRSGTTVFRRTLQTHPRVVDLGEIFNEANPASYFQFLQKAVTSETAALLPSRSNRMFLEYVESCLALALARNQQCRVMVLDVKYDQAHLLCEPWLRLGELPRLYFLLRERKWKVIDIRRRDPFRLSISNRVAIESSLYHSDMLDSGQKQTAKVYIDPARLIEDVAATRKAYAAVKQHFRGRVQYRQICYEEMFADVTGARFSAPLLAEVARFLNLENAFDPKPKLQKLLQEDIFSYISNAAQIRALMEADAAHLSGQKEADAKPFGVKGD
jgi:hypothetical protein